MHATIARDLLVRVLDLVKHAGQAESNALMPLYAHVRLGVEKGALHAACLSIEGAARAAAPLAQGAPSEDGAVAVSFRRLYDVAKMSEDGPLDLEEQGARLAIRTPDGLTHLPLLPEPDQLLNPWTLTIPENAASLVIDATTLAEGVRAVRHAAAAKDDARPAFRGVCLDVGPEGSAVVATDGPRLATVALQGHVDRASQVILPPTAVDALLEALAGCQGLVQVDVHPTVAHLEAEGVAVRCQGIALEFPPWKRVFASFTESRTIPGLTAARLAALCRRALAVVGAHAPATLRVGPAGVLLEAESGDGRVEGAIGPPEHAVPIPLNPRYLAEACEAAPHETVMVIPLTRDTTAPMAVLLRTGAWRAVIMRREL